MYVWAGLSTLPRDLTNKRDSRLCRVNLSCSWWHARAWPGDTWASTESAQVSYESSLLRGFRHYNLFDLYLLLVPLSSLLGGLAGTLSVNGDIISCHRIGSLYFVIPSRLGTQWLLVIAIEKRWRNTKQMCCFWWSLLISSAKLFCVVREIYCHVKSDCSNSDLLVLLTLGRFSFSAQFMQNKMNFRKTRIVFDRCKKMTMGGMLFPNHLEIDHTSRCDGRRYHTSELLVKCVSPSSEVILEIGQIYSVIL